MKLENLDFVKIVKNKDEINLTKFNGVICKSKNSVCFEENNGEVIITKIMGAFPTYAYIVDGFGYGYRYMPNCEEVKKWVAENLADGVYIASFRYAFFQTGSARGSNWYGVKLYQQ